MPSFMLHIFKHNRRLFVKKVSYRSKIIDKEQSPRHIKLKKQDAEWCVQTILPVSRKKVEAFYTHLHTHAHRYMQRDFPRKTPKKLITMVFYEVQDGWKGDLHQIFNLLTTCVSPY